MQWHTPSQKQYSFGYAQVTKFVCLLAQQPIERKQRKFNALVIPKAVEASLPFKSKRKDTPSRRRPLLEDRRAVVMEPHERKTHAMLQSLRVIKTEKVFRLILCFFFFFVDKRLILRLILCLNPLEYHN